MESTDPKLAKISTALDKGYLSIRTGKSWYTLIAKTIGFVIWFVGITVFLRIAYLDGLVNGSFIFSMSFFALFGLGTGIALLWGFFGKEVLTIKNKQVLLNKHIFGLGITYVLEKGTWKRKG